jgi:hypothetical protein
VLMDAKQYGAWLKARQVVREKDSKPPRPPKPARREAAQIEQVPFAVWTAAQVERTDSIGVLARDLLAECQRCEREIAAMRNHLDLMWFADHAPRELKLSREVAQAAWSEWLNFVQKEEAAASDSST